MTGAAKLIDDLQRQSQKAGTQLRQALFSIRDEIAALKRRVQEISELPVSQDVAASPHMGWAL